MQGTEAEQSYVPFDRMGHFAETWTTVDDATVYTLRMFTQPPDCLGVGLKFDIGKIGSHDVRISSIYGVKSERETLSSGDSLVIFSITTPSGLFLLSDLEDGFTVVNRERWRQITDQAKSIHIPAEADSFFAVLNHQFTQSPEVQDWLQQSVGIVKQLDSSISHYLSLPNHASPTTEIALKEVIRSYLTVKNEFRKRTLGQIFLDSEPGKELVNGIFGVSGLFIPKEASLIPELSGTSTSGSTIGGFAVCRSLADIGISTTFPEPRVYLTDVNAFFDLFLSRVKPLLSKDQIAQIQQMIYSKIDQLYAAFNNQGIVFPLTEEESHSAPVPALPTIAVSGATDGAYHRIYSHEDGDARVLFLSTISDLMQNPTKLLNTLRKHPADDYTAFTLSFA